VSLALAVTAGLGSAIFYGVATAGQHAAAYTGAQRADAGKLRKLASSPRWLLASCGDVVGIALQLVALASGPVVLVQPLLVVSLPIAVVLRSRFGGARPSRSDLGHCLLLILGLALFFLLLGEPSRGRIIGAHAAAVTSSLAFLWPSQRCATVGRRHGRWCSERWPAAGSGWSAYCWRRCPRSGRAVSSPA